MVSDEHVTLSFREGGEMLAVEKAFALQYFEVMSMIASDWPIQRVDAVFFHARSFNGDDDGLFELASELTSTISENAVVINGGDGEGFTPGTRVWPGKDEYTRRLQALGCKVFPSNPASRTLEEGFEFSGLAEENGWKRAVVIGQPFQLLRIMRTHLKVMKKRKYHMDVYAVAPRSVDYNKVTSGNQGRSSIVRWSQMEMEFDRGALYEAQGNLATIRELIEYMLIWRRGLYP